MTQKRGIFIRHSFALLAGLSWLLPMPTSGQAPADGVVAAPGTQALNAPWSSVRHDVRRTGRTPHLGPQTLPQVHARYSLNGAVREPVIEAFGRTYLTMLAGDGSARGFLLTLTREGMLEWTGLSQVFGVPDIGADGTTLYLTEKTGMSAWLSPGPHGSIIPQHTLSWRVDGLHTPTVAPSGLIYALSSAASPPVRRTVILAPDSTQLHTFESESYGRPAFAEDGTLYQFGGADTLDAFDPDGTPRWSVTLDTPTNNIGYAPPVVGDSGDVIVSGTTELSAVRPDGTLRWRQPVRFGTFAHPALRWNDSVVLPENNGIRAFSIPLGFPTWEFRTTQPGYAPVVDGAGLTYFTDPEGVGALGPDGRLRWRLPLEGLPRDTRLAIGLDRTLLIASAGQLLVLR